MRRLPRSLVASLLTVFAITAYADGDLIRPFNYYFKKKTYRVSVVEEWEYKPANPKQRNTPPHRIGVKRTLVRSCILGDVVVTVPDRVTLCTPEFWEYMDVTVAAVMSEGELQGRILVIHPNIYKAVFLLEDLPREVGS